VQNVASSGIHAKFRAFSSEYTLVELSKDHCNLANLGAKWLGLLGPSRVGFPNGTGDLQQSTSLGYKVKLVGFDLLLSVDNFGGEVA
jgi:hypothetical protein